MMFWDILLMPQLAFIGHWIYGCCDILMGA